MNKEISETLKIALKRLWNNKQSYKGNDDGYIFAKYEFYNGACQALIGCLRVLEGQNFPNLRAGWPMESPNSPEDNNG